MKKNIFSSIAVAALALMTLGACSDSEYTEKYQKPSTTKTATVPDVFTSVLYKGNTWMNPMYYRYYCQMTTSATYSGIFGNSNSKGRFMGAGEPRYNDRWKNFYDMLTQYRLLQKTYNGLDDSQKPNNEVFLVLSRVLVDAQLHEMLSLFGSVPFNGAGTLWENSDYAGAKEKAVYENDTDLYKQILQELQDAADYFANGGPNSVAQASLKNKDYTRAAGDISLWQKYINSLRLRIGLHLATNGTLVAEGKATIANVLNNPSKYPVIESNDENMGVDASTANDDFNFGKSLSQALHGGYTPSQAYLDALNVPANGIPTADTDPRLTVLLDPNPDGEYISYDVTKSNQEISNIASEKQKEYAQRTPSIVGAGYYCTLDSTAYAGIAEYNGNNNTFGLWISAAEVSLSKSEAYLMGYGVSKDDAKAKENFVNGVKQSSDYLWNVKTTSSFYDAKNPNDSYYSKRECVKPSDEAILAYAEKIWKPEQSVVATQLWLNFSWTNTLEAWNVTRRTGFPKVTFSADGITTNYPTPANRLPYPSDEQNYNQQHYQEAVAKYYGNGDTYGYYTKLFWATTGEYYKLSGVKQ